MREKDERRALGVSFQKALRRENRRIKNILAGRRIFISRQIKNSADGGRKPQYCAKKKQKFHVKKLCLGKNEADFSSEYEKEIE